MFPSEWREVEIIRQQFLTSVVVSHELHGESRIPTTKGGLQGANSISIVNDKVRLNPIIIHAAIEVNLGEQAHIGFLVSGAASYGDPLGIGMRRLLHAVP